MCDPGTVFGTPCFLVLSGIELHLLATGIELRLCFPRASGILGRTQQPSGQIVQLLITGASGNVGQALVPLLCERGLTPILVGRDPKKLKQQFPILEAISYADLSSNYLDRATVVHLAAINNNSKATEAEMRSCNVDLLIHTARTAAAGGAEYFINVSSIHGLDPNNHSPYARTKREGAQQLKDIGDLNVITLYLASVHGGKFSGRLSALNRFPAPIARAAFAVLSALKPTIHVTRIAEFIVAPSSAKAQSEIILTDDMDLNPVYRAGTRFIDLLAAAGILIGLSWLLLGLWVAVRTTSPGPGLFAQTRIGRYGQPFTCYKFRTMADGTAQVGTHDAPATAVTPLGITLRRLKLDELPQAWNLLRNEMSLIGPRPCLPVQSDLIAARRVMEVLDMKPGISGLAQVNNVDMSDPERLARWDARYGALRCLALDFKLMWQTLGGSGRGDRVASVD